MNAEAWSDLADGSLLDDSLPNADLIDLLRYVETGVAAGPLSSEIDEAVAQKNRDRKWVERVWSVSSTDENLIRRCHIQVNEAHKKGLREGFEQGIAEGRAQGIEQGIEQSEAQFAALTTALLEAERFDDLKRAATDKEFRDQLLRKLAN